MEWLGSPTSHVETPDGALLLWATQPFLATKMDGYADVTVGEAIEAFYKEHFYLFDFVVTVHDWSHLTDYDRECRKMMQQLTHFMRPKQHEIVIHLGETNSFGQKAVQVAAETITKFKRMPIELFNDDTVFESRLRSLKHKYTT